MKIRVRLQWFSFICNESLGVLSQEFNALAQPLSSALVTRELIMLRPGEILEQMLCSHQLLRRVFGSAMTRCEYY